MPISGSIVSRVEIVQCLPSRSYGGSPRQISMMWPIDSANISLRSMPRMPSASASDSSAPGPDAEQEPSLQQVVQHRGLRGDQDRVGVRQVGRAGAELDLPRVGDQARQKQHGVRDALGRIGEVLADVGLGIAQPVGKYDGLAVFVQDLRVVPVEAVDRHGEESELHGTLAACRAHTRVRPRDSIA